MPQQEFFVKHIAVCCSKGLLIFSVSILLLACPSSWQIQSSKLPKPRVRNISVNVELPKNNNAKLGAEIWSPARSVSPIEPKTVVIFVPGSGTASRKGTQSGDGALHYRQSVDVSTVWATSLAAEGYFSLLYDKRNCSNIHDNICLENPVFDLNQEGPIALARDVDAACHTAKKQMGDDVRIVLWTSDQGTQVVLSSHCKEEAALFVFVAPIPYRVDEYWVEGLSSASEKPQNDRVKGVLEQKSRSMKATFDSIEAGQFAPSAKIMGASLQFWKEWISLTDQTEAMFKQLTKPVLLIIGAEDGFYNEKAISILQSETNSPKKRLLYLSAADHNLLINNELNPETADIVLRALARGLNGV